MLVQTTIVQLTHSPYNYWYESNCETILDNLLWDRIGNRPLITNFAHAFHVSLVPRPSMPPVFDRPQYAKSEGEGIGNFITWSVARL